MKTIGRAALCGRPIFFGFLIFLGVALFQVKITE